MHIYISQLNPTIGNLEANTESIISSISAATAEGADLIVFPELSICGYPPEDFLLLPHFLEAMQQQLNHIVKASHNITAIVGCIRENPSTKEKQLFNSAAIIQNGELLGFQDKLLLPTYDIFDERRYFEPGKEISPWDICGKRVGISICEDIWQHSGLLNSSAYLLDPINELKDANVDLLINISSSPFSRRKFDTRLNVCSKAATTLQCPVVLCNQAGANDSIIFDGYSIYVDAQGKLIKHAKGFEADHILIDTSTNEPPSPFTYNPIEGLYQALVTGVKDYFKKQGFTKACLGLSGGIDSAVVACIAAEALGADQLLCVSMPSRYSSDSSLSDAKSLALNLGSENRVISIETVFQTYLNLLEPHFENKKSDATEENLQARIRGMILMATSNKHGYILLSTGNKSELAMGYSTLYGDMCGGLSVISDVTKGEVYDLARWINREKEIIPENTIVKPPSAELRPNQKDSDSLPDYAIIDMVLKEYVEEHLDPNEIASKHGIDRTLVNELVRKIHLNEYKRRQSPPGLRVSEKSFTTGRRFPIVQGWVT
ncbi:MAG: NAD+ synthase (glutamine-hydrolyzing) [Chlamydiales bacterium]|jgi:NAD+ synthase (glutamine-hydrolysing)